MVNVGGTLTVQDSNFNANRGASFAGAIFNGDGIALNSHDRLARQRFQGNSAGTSGGGVRTPVCSAASGSITGCKFSGNQAGFGGGGIDVFGGALTIAATTIADNGAAAQGGGVQVTQGGDSRLTMTGSSATPRSAAAAWPTASPA